MSDAILSSRRALRVPARCAVRAEAGASWWLAETEDVGPNGCRLTGALPLKSGQAVRLTITAPRVRRVLEATGRVAWTNGGPHSGGGVASSCGVAFDEAVRPASHLWFDSLVTDDPELLLQDGTPDHLGAETTLHLGQPPARPGQLLSPDDLEVLAVVGGGVSVGTLQSRFSATWPRTRRVVLGLLSRRLLTVVRREGSSASAWGSHLAAPSGTP